MVSNMTSYSALVREQLKNLSQIEQFEVQCFVERQPHETLLKTYLDLLGFLVLDPSVELRIENVTKLWEMFVNEQNYALEQTLFIKWINQGHLLDTDR